MLIVEDEILIQKSIKKILEQRGHTVFATASGRDAVRLIAEEKFDRIICDLMLGDITGFDVIEESKKVYSAKDIGNHFVIMTAYSSPQVHDEARKYGCIIINKPFDDLNEAIDLFIGGNNG